MKNLSKLLFSVSILALLLSCSSMQSLDISYRSRSYEQDYLTVFKACLDYCNFKGIAVKYVDKELGIIDTDFKEKDPDFTRGILGILSESRIKINFSVKKKSDKTNVVVNASIEDLEGSEGTWRQVNLTEDEAKGYYDKIFRGIENQL